MKNSIYDRKKSVLPVIFIHLAFMAVLLTVFIISENTGGRIFRLLRSAGLEKVTYEGFTAVTPDHLSDNLILVNRDHPLPEDYEPDIVFYRDTDVYMNSTITEAYGELSDYIRDNIGDHLYVSSTYRSYDDQQRVYEEEGPDIAALPGTSEHQTGLAVDVYVMYHAGMAFLDSSVGRYVNERCGDYGFIIRYPYAAERITGYDYEPWHLRYVGHPHSDLIMDSGITLEEYLDMLETGSWYRTDKYVLGKVPEDNICVPTSLLDCEMTFSPDLCGNVIVTIREG